MDDIWVRIALIASVVVLATGIAWMQRRRAMSPVRSVKAPEFAAGVYFFSSVSCTTCSQARDKLDSALGSEGYTEIAWEQQPGPFEEIGLDAVPAVMIVNDRGRGRLYIGQPDQALGEV